jgi:uncharacterized protein (DUF1697 family)
MKRYVALLRGVSPMNAKMPELKRCFERAGFRNVKTVLSSGNVVFDSAMASPAAIERRIETALPRELGRSFLTNVRGVEELATLLERDPYAGFGVPDGAKRVVTFLRAPPVSVPALPLERDGVTICVIDGREVFTAYVAGPRGPVFMEILAKLFGTAATTRTWDTIRKCVAA